MISNMPSVWIFVTWLQADLIRWNLKAKSTVYILCQHPDEDYLICGLFSFLSLIIMGLVLRTILSHRLEIRTWDVGMSNDGYLTYMLCKRPSTFIPPESTLLITRGGHCSSQYHIW